MAAAVGDHICSVHVSLQSACDGWNDPRDDGGQWRQRSLLPSLPHRKAASWQWQQNVSHDHAFVHHIQWELIACFSKNVHVNFSLIVLRSTVNDLFLWLDTLSTSSFRSLQSQPRVGCPVKCIWPLTLTNASHGTLLSSFRCNVSAKHLMYSYSLKQ